ncbi:hypothetical protein V6N13_040733 [Hibiscus sabdariffa]|uniref:Uncharacterized protein n=1 Tax=Hibiscus sabdariffa TaxID=183260 RepID=A0ABR2R9A0_9ROSI
MTTILQSSLLGFDYAIQVPATLTKSRKKWHSLFVTIYCSRKFSSLVLKSPTSEHESDVVHRSPSYVSLTVVPQSSSFGIDQTTLVELVKDTMLHYSFTRPQCFTIRTHA